MRTSGEERSRFGSSSAPASQHLRKRHRSQKRLYFLLAHKHARHVSGEWDLLPNSQTQFRASILPTKSPSTTLRPEIPHNPSAHHSSSYISAVAKSRARTTHRPLIASDATPHSHPLSSQHQAQSPPATPPLQPPAPLHVSPPRSPDTSPPAGDPPRS